MDHYNYINSSRWRDNPARSLSDMRDKATAIERLVGATMQDERRGDELVLNALE
jgi:hypothetical protein